MTTVLVPPNAKPRKFLSYQLAYDSAYVNCVPSYYLQQGAQNQTGTAIQNTDLISALSLGWYVNTPDYEGPKAAYTSVPQSAYGTLDSIRAVLASSSITEIDANARTVMWGYSGGAIASEWASELQQSFSPELNIAGTAIGGIPSNVTDAIVTTNLTRDAVAGPAAFLGLANGFPDFADLLQRQLRPKTANEFRTLEGACLADSQKIFTRKNIFKYFKDGDDILQRPVYQSTVKTYGDMGNHGVPRMPLYFYKAIGDEVSPIRDTTKLYNEYCAKGARIQYVKYAVGNHEIVSITGSAGALSFLKARMDGEPVAAGCSTRTAVA